MAGIIDGYDFHSLEAQKYWSFPSTWSAERIAAEEKAAIFSGNYIGSRKVDGAFYKFVKDGEGNMELLGRAKSKVTGDYLDKLGHVPHLHEYFKALPNGTCLLGELYFEDNEGSNKVTTIMGCLEPKAVARQESGPKLSYYIFDILAYDGISYMKKPVEERFAALSQLFHAPFVNVAKPLKTVELWQCLQDTLSSGGEGIVITKVGSLYSPAKRPARQTIKIKKELAQNLYVVIVGANPPTREYKGKEIEEWTYWEYQRTGEKAKGFFYFDYSTGVPIEPVTKAHFYGWAGSLKIGAYKDGDLIQIGSLTGLTDEVLSNWKSYVGKVASITAMQIMDTENKGLRHARLIKWEDSFNPSEATYEKIFL